MNHLFLIILVCCFDVGDLQSMKSEQQMYPLERTMLSMFFAVVLIEISCG